jgi:hypothetical protein
MTIKAASKKANMDPCAAGKYYRRYLKDNKIEAPAGKLRRTFTQDEKDELIGYIVDDGMSIKEASAKLNMCAGTGLKHYNRYLKDYNLTAPLLKFPQERIDELIGYIVDGKMSVMAASKKANMSNSAGHRYYHQYLKDNHIDIPKHE